MSDDNSTQKTPAVEPDFSRFLELRNAIQTGEYTPNRVSIVKHGSGEAVPPSQEPGAYAFLECLLSLGKIGDKSDAGYVYLVSCGRRYKIGMSKDVSKRIAGMMLPPTAKIVCTIKSDEKRKLERELHEKFASKRRKGEWFRLTAADVEYIKSLASAT